jgi:hypothetical protein
MESVTVEAGTRWFLVVERDGAKVVIDAMTGETISAYEMTPYGAGMWYWIKSDLDEFQERAARSPGVWTGHRGIDVAPKRRAECPPELARL